MWIKGELLFNPKVEHVRAQIDLSRNKLVLPSYNLHKIRRWTLMSIAVTDAIIESYTSGR